MRCSATLLVAVMSTAHLAHTKRVRHILATKHEAAHGNYLGDPVQPPAVAYGGAASWQLPLGNDPPTISGQSPIEQNGSSKTWSNLFHGTSTDNQWQPPGEEGTERDGEEKKEDPAAETENAEEEKKEAIQMLLESRGFSARRGELNEEEPTSGKAEEPQMEVDNEESTEVELTTFDKEIITAKAMLDKAMEDHSPPLEILQAAAQGDMQKVLEWLDKGGSVDAVYSHSVPTQNARKWTRPFMPTLEDAEESRRMRSEAARRGELNEEEPKSGKSEKPQMEVDNEESTKVELTAFDKTTDSILDKAEADLIVAQAAFDAILPSQQFFITAKAILDKAEADLIVAQAAFDAILADAQKALDAAQKKVIKARKRWYVKR